MARVLVVEDDEDIRGLIVARVKNGNHFVNNAGSADEALTMVRERGAPDIVILDVGLPGMDGLQLLVALREQLENPNLPAIFLSARVSAEDIAAGHKLNASYLTKPFVASALLNEIRTALGAEVPKW